MLTRLEVDGFKNLDRVDVRFGPFTCIAGPNGVGKSNLFDAIAFLSALADKPLMEAAMSVRGGDARRGDVRTLFRRVGGEIADTMKFAVEMIIPPEGEDSLGQPAKASMTFLRYELDLRFRSDPTVPAMGVLELVKEEMKHINRSEARKRLGFPHSKAWREKAIDGRRTSPYISTEVKGGQTLVSIHADAVRELGGGRPRRVPASSLPRTMLSSVNNAEEHRTLVLARQEMLSWTQLQLEPSALRAPDGLNAPQSIGPNGAHVPAALYGLARAAEKNHVGGASDVYASVANKLSELVEDVRRVSVDVDEKRQLLNIVMRDRNDTEHVASALSDGTLRFLALTVMEADPNSRRLLCLEEPENGMHPLRIPAVIELLGELAADVQEPMDAKNPLRQVIVNTHSPAVVACVDADALLVAAPEPNAGNQLESPSISLRHLEGTWRAKAERNRFLTRGDMLIFLDPLSSVRAAGRVGATRVLDSQFDLPFPAPPAGLV